MLQIQTIYTIVRNFLNKLKQDSVSAHAAQASFFIIMSAFPFFMFLLSMIQYLPLTEQDLIVFFSNYLPSAFSPYVVDIISEIYTSSTTTLLSVTAFVAVWSASRAFYSLIYGLNSVYGTPENRNYFILRLTATLYTAVFAVMLIASLGILAFGNALTLGIQKIFPSFGDFALLLISIRATASMCILILFFLVLYMFVPNRQSKILYELPGAIATSTGWIGFSYLYSFYIDHMSNFTNTYGSLTAVVLLMLWLYACMYMLLLGGELNVYLRSFYKKKENIVEENKTG